MRVEGIGDEICAAFSINAKQTVIKKQKHYGRQRNPFDTFYFTTKTSKINISIIIIINAMSSE